MIHSAVRIIGDQWDEAAGRHRRVALGTGFCVRVPSETFPDEHYGYLLTAHHVIDSQPNVELEIADPHNPGALYPRVAVSDWQQPIEELDLALAPFSPPPGYTVTAIDLGEHLREHLPPAGMLGAQFFYVGLLASLNRIMARSGTLGAVDQPDIEHEDGYKYTAHLADCRSYGGFSGSPCFIELPHPTLTSKEPAIAPPESVGPVGRIVYLHLLCGMFTSHLERPMPGDAVSRLGVGIILSSDEIWRALMTNDLVKRRRELDAISDEPDAKPTNVSTSPQGEFARFEDLARKLVNVPKKDVDDKRKDVG